MFSRIGAAAIRKDLTNTRLLLAAFDNPESKFKSLHIAGTNGKGSVSHMLAAIFQMAGYKTGLYTSPHLYDFRERIKINGALCSEDFVISFTERVKGLIEEIDPSFFEITVAMAFEYFATNNVDIAIIETGLGGRLDSTNVIQPELSVVTNIGWDHMQLLGNTLKEIAGEKAGIIKKDTPVVIGETDPETKNVFIEKAAITGSKIVFADQLYQHEILAEDDGSLHIRLNSGNDPVYYRLDLMGIYQAKNLKTVLAAVEMMKAKGWKLESNVVKKAVANVVGLTGLHGRWEVLSRSPKIVLDVAHNSNGINELLKQLDREEFNQLHIILGMVKDKDISSVLQILPANARYYFTKADIPRAMDEKQLAEIAAKAGLQGETYRDVNMAIESCRQAAAPGDLIVVCGSVFLVAEVDRTKINPA